MESQGWNVESETNLDQGKLREVTYYRRHGVDFVVEGKFPRILRPKEEWDVDIDDPVALLEAVSDGPFNADLLQFIQRVPHSRPRFRFYWEWDNFAVLPLTNSDHWYQLQITQAARNKVRLSRKRNVVVQPVQPTPKLFGEIADIYNETPIRQDRRYWNYGLGLQEARIENTLFADRSLILGAYLKDQLIGYIRLVFSAQLARTMGILCLESARTYAPMNALLAAAVQSCCDRGTTHLIYGKYSYGNFGSESLQEFKWSNGFQGYLVPRYWIPLTTLGRMLLSLGLHRPLKDRTPKVFVKNYRKIRSVILGRGHFRSASNPTHA